MYINGCISDNQKWQEYWQRQIIYPSASYNTPSGAVGCRFIKKLAELIEGIQTHKLNAEEFIVFQIVILQHSPNVKQAKDIRKQISRRMDTWEDGKFTILIWDTERAMESILTTK
jgi:hypothetical protein